MTSVFLATSAITCGCCNRGIRKAHAIVAGRLYCHTCYMRELDPEPCSKCRKPTRLQTDEGIALCRSCRNIDRKCLRCDKPVPRASLTLPQGVACAACSRYYKQPQPCAACGQMSLRLSRDFKQGFMDPVCQKCRRRGNVTCACCGKDRRPAGVNNTGKAICQTCVDMGGKAYVCPKCHKEGRRHSATRCDECYWAETAAKRADEAAANFTHLWARDTFLMFFEELRKRIPAQKAALRIERYFMFFAKLDSAIPDPRAVTAQALAAMFGADGLRRNAVPYGYLIKAGIVTPSTDQEIQAGIEERQQNALLERSRDKWYEELLTRFRAHLREVNQRYVRRGWVGTRARFLPRSITAAMRAATIFLEGLDSEAVTTPQQLQQDQINRFLREHAGYRESLRSFVRYLNRKVKLFRPVRIESIDRGMSKGLILQRPRYDELAKTWLVNPSDEQLKESLVCALMLLYAQPVTRVTRLRMSELRHARDGIYRIAFGGLEIPIDTRVGKLLDRYLAHRSAIATMDDTKKNPYLFTGRRVGSHLTEAAVTYYLRKYHVRAEQLYATAIFRAYLSGLRHPKVLTRAFGISAATAIHYMEIIDPRLRDEVEQRAVNA